MLETIIKVSGDWSSYAPSNLSVVKNVNSMGFCSSVEFSTKLQKEWSERIRHNSLYLLYMLLLIFTFYM